MIFRYCLFIFLILFSTLNASTIRIITNEEPPTNYMENKRVIGITVDVVKKLQEKLKLDTKIEFMTWSRAYALAKKEKNIVLFTAGKTTQRIKEGFYFIGPVITKKAALFKNSSSDFKIESLLDIKDKKLKIGSMRGDWRSDYFLDKGLDVQEVSNHNQNIQKLINKEIDLWAISNIEATFIAKKANISRDEIESAYMFKEITSFIMLSKKTPRRDIQLWKKAYKDLQKTDFFKKTAKKWSRILHIELEYSNHKGFYIK